jgi:hypothetical protein
MKGRLILAMAAAAMVTLPASVDAQAAGAIELGAVGRYQLFDGEVGVKNAPGIGGRLGVFFLPNLSIEADWTYAEPELEDQPGYQGRTFVAHELLQARLLYTLWFGDNAGLLLGAGYSYDDYSRVRTVGVRGGGPSGLLGLRYKFTDRISSRLEGYGYFVPEDVDAFPVPRPSTFNLGVQAGLSVTFREREIIREVALPAPPPDTIVVTRDPDLPQGTASQICLATGENVTIYVTAQGDTLVGPRRVSVQQLGPGVAFAGEYAAGRDWFVNDQPIPFENRTYAKSGGEVGLDCDNIRRVGEHMGVPLFAERAAQSPYQTIYVPVRPGVWQGYQTDLARVRGQF